MLCDLHTHSWFSDGSLSPAELIKKAKQLDLIIALTDHNTVAGLPEFMAAAEQQNVTAVAGVELSTLWEGHDLHLLGLFLQPEYYDAVTQLTQEFHILKAQSNIELIRRLNAAGYAIDYATIQKRNQTGSVNRGHIAAELRDNGYVSSVKEAFDTLLGESHGFYVPPKRLSTLDGIRFMRQIKAIPVLAHPLKELSEAELRRLLPDAAEAGLVGMEILHCSYDAEKRALASQIAAEFDLLPSGGSDYHGTVKPDVQLAFGKGDMEVKRSIYDNLLTAWHELYE